MNDAKADFASKNCGASLGQPQHPAIGGVIGASIGEIVKRLFGHTDDMGIHKGGPFAGAVFASAVFTPEGGRLAPMIFASLEAAAGSAAAGVSLNSAKSLGEPILYGD